MPSDALQGPLDDSWTPVVLQENEYFDEKRSYDVPASATDSISLSMQVSGEMRSQVAS